MQCFLWKLAVDTSIYSHKFVRSSDRLPRILISPHIIFTTEAACLDSGARVFIGKDIKIEWSSMERTIALFVKKAESNLKRGDTNKQDIDVGRKDKSVATCMRLKVLATFFIFW